MKFKWLLTLPLIAGVSMLGVACGGDQPMPDEPSEDIPVEPMDPETPEDPAGTP